MLDRASEPVRVVLVVEDDPPVRELLAGAINEERGYLAVPVGTGSEALRALETVNPDLVLLDIGLPGLSGIEVYDRMREDRRLRDVPVVFETASGYDHAQELRDRGVAAFIRKPFDLNDVVAYVKKLASPPARASVR